MYKGAIMTSFEVVYQHLSAGIEEHHEKLQ
jgi:hypothetical protein